MVETKPVGYRLPTELIARLDAYVVRMAEQTPGMRFTQADAVRVLLTKALDAEGVPAKDRAKPRSAARSK